jgi:hypothetical protein
MSGGVQARLQDRRRVDGRLGRWRRARLALPAGRRAGAGRCGGGARGRLRDGLGHRGGGSCRRRWSRGRHGPARGRRRRGLVRCRRVRPWVDDDSVPERRRATENGLSLASCRLAPHPCDGRQATGDRAADLPTAHEAHLSFAGNRGDHQCVIPGDLLGPDPRFDATFDAADPSGTPIARNAGDRHVPERRRHRGLTLGVDLHGAHVDPELSQPAIGT